MAHALCQPPWNKSKMSYLIWDQDLDRLHIC